MKRSLTVDKIRMQLQKLPESGLLPEERATACSEAAALLERIEAILANSSLPETAIVKKLRAVLALPIS